MMFQSGSTPLIVMVVPHTFGRHLNFNSHLAHFGIARWSKQDGRWMFGASASGIEKLRYMHRNPVKGGLVESPEQWKRITSSIHTRSVEAGIAH
jgi:hypothetical protein